MKDEEKFFNKRSNMYAYSVLGLLLFVRIAVIWQRKSIGYIFGYQGEGIKLGDPKFELLSFYPEMDSYYGILSGLAYTLPYSICGLSVGMMKGGFNRKNLMSLIIILAGLT